jgi:hypothetical protein
MVFGGRTAALIDDHAQASRQHRLAWLPASGMVNLTCKRINVAFMIAGILA